jgi:hypothetical protein
MVCPVPLQVPNVVPLLATRQRPDSIRIGSVVPHRPSDASAEAGDRRATIGGFSRRPAANMEVLYPGYSAMNKEPHSAANDPD